MKKHRISMRQRGSALVVAMVFLLVMTLIGTTAMQGTSQQETMAGNMRDRNLAFQAAEAALLDAERFLDGGGAVTANVATRDWLSFNWGGARAYSGTIEGIAEQPSYVIENIGAVDVGGSVAVGQASLSSDYYLITALGIGGSPDARVILQSTYRR